MISTALPSSPPPPNSAQQIQLRNSENVTTGSVGSRIIPQIIPKIGAIVKRFSLNYSGEGLVTDPHRVRTVRVGIKFQVQVDSFLNNSVNTPQLAANGPQQIRPRGIIRTNSAPHSIDHILNAANNCDSSSYSTPSITDVTNNSTNNNKQFVIERHGGNPTLHRNFTSAGNLNKENLQGFSNCSDSSSSGVSSCGGSNPQSPINGRRHSSSPAFHNRINQALSLCRNQLAAARGGERSDYLGRRNSVQVYRRTNSTCHSPERSPSISSSPTASGMEDSSSYQILRCFPGSNVNSVREFSWETAAFEKDVREKVQWLGSKFSKFNRPAFYPLRLRVPPFVQNLLAAMKSYAMENPVTSVFILAVVVASALPVSIFLGFAIATILVSFLGFLFVEGTLLTVASVTFGGVVLVVGLVTLFFALLGSAGYVTTSKVYYFITGKDLKDLFYSLPLIGQFFDKETSSPSSSSAKSNGSAFKLSNGNYSSPKEFSFSDEDDEEEEEEDLEEEDDDDDEDEGNVEVVDSENETDENDGSVTSSSDVGIGDSTSIENVDQIFKPEDDDSLDGFAHSTPEKNKVKIEEVTSSSIPILQVNGNHEETQ